MKALGKKLPKVKTPPDGTTVSDKVGNAFVFESGDWRVKS